jgi:hypothetical protein
MMKEFNGLENMQMDQCVDSFVTTAKSSVPSLLQHVQMSCGILHCMYDEPQFFTSTLGLTDKHSEGTSVLNSAWRGLYATTYFYLQYTSCMHVLC